MSLAWVLFSLIAVGTASSAAGVVLARSVIHAAVCLLFTLIGVSLLYFLLGAEFLGAAQLIVYVGGTMVLVVFGVMLTGSGPTDKLRTAPIEWLIGSTLAAMLFGLLVTLSPDLGRRPPPSAEPLPDVKALGTAFLGVPEKPDGLAFLLPFEVVSAHLLVVLIAAAYLARAKRRASGG
jgi:NADH-quinone oxidoreductase subunit J